VGVALTSQGLFLVALVLLCACQKPRDPTQAPSGPRASTSRHCLRDEAPNQRDRYAIEDVSQALEIVDSAKDMEWLWSAGQYFATHGLDQLAPLLDRLAERREVGLVNTADLIIWSRIELGDLPFMGHGYNVKDDLFTVAGRANWILSESTCRVMGYVVLTTRTPRLRLLRSLWARQLAGEDLGLQFDDPRISDLPWLSRQALHELVARLALQTTLTSARRGDGDGEEWAEHRDSTARLLHSLTGQDFGADPVRWSTWLDQNQQYLFFDWHRFTMAVDEGARRAKRPIAEEGAL
jgi:hypothetical protein